MLVGAPREELIYAHPRPLSRGRGRVHRVFIFEDYQAQNITACPEFATVRRKALASIKTPGNRPILNLAIQLKT